MANSSVDKIINRYSTSPKAEKILNACLIISMVFGLLVVAVMLIAASVIAADDTLDIVMGGYSSAGIIFLALIILILMIIWWAMQKVLLNISNNLHAIKDLTEVLARNKECQTSESKTSSSYAKWE